LKSHLVSQIIYLEPKCLQLQQHRKELQVKMSLKMLLQHKLRQQILLNLHELHFITLGKISEEDKIESIQTSLLAGETSMS